MSNEEPDDLWPVLPSEAVQDALSDPHLPVELFSAIVALTVAIAENPWLEASTVRDSAGDWRRLPIPHGRGLVEYVIDTDNHLVRLTRVIPL
ncbi:hypothetical protein F7Q99_29180 [Streptomyces kaniharaensis]|uniref:Type II toxin-antitoxin system RelE/ParE family toxin n=1 Tax=Streptomyces kaniharaensis TaxID=212423 RepID=A0A6N7L308_9ACTN|nr:hypothetical protein [Streptomyces kaniharaensis]MQS16193.1 hypothetical protein [Streptomyces kaniharaensis]